MIKNTGLERLYLQIKDRLNEAYHEINLSGEPIDGKYCKSVENKLKQITGRKHARVTTSGTSAIQTALIAWKIKNKKVACANYSFVASANQAAYNNEVDFIEIDQKGLMEIDQQFDHDAIIPVSLYGNMIDYDGLSISNHTKVIVDSAQSLGSKYKGKPDGSFGDVAVFSFARNKPIPTNGTHGALVWDDDAMTDKIRAASMNGKLSRNGGIVSAGINAQPFELQAAQIDIGLDHMQEWQNRRTQIFEYYSNKFANLPLQIIVAPEYCECNNHKFAMLSDRRDDLWGHLTDNKIQALLHYTDNFAKSHGSKKQYPMTDKFCQQIITLPNHPWLTDSEIEIIADTVKQYYQN